MSKKNTGQAMITVIFVTVISLLVLTGVMTAFVSNAEEVMNQELSSVVLDAAESGIEDGILRLTRDPSYTGSSMTLDNGVGVTVSVSGSGEMTMTSTAIYHGFVRQVVVTFHYSNLNLVLDSWSELP